jgi:hypothetical protein
VVRSWNPIARPFVVRVSPDPDLADACALMSRFPNAASSSWNTVSLSPSTVPEVPGLQRMYPPPLKNALITALLEKVIDLSMLEVEFHVPLLVVVPAATDDIAVALGDPAATEAASVARSVISAALMAMVLPADTAAVEVRVSLVWLAMLAIPVNSEFHCDA